MSPLRQDQRKASNLKYFQRQMMFCPRTHTNAPREIRKGCVVVKCLKERASLPLLYQELLLKNYFYSLRISYFNPSSPLNSSLVHSPFLPTQLCVLFSFLNPWSPICASYTQPGTGPATEVWSLKKRLSLSQQLSIINSFLTCGGTLYLHPHRHANILSGLSCTTPVHAVITL